MLSSFTWNLTVTRVPLSALSAVAASSIQRRGTIDELPVTTDSVVSNLSDEFNNPPSITSKTSNKLLSYSIYALSATIPGVLLRLITTSKVPPGAVSTLLDEK